MEVHGFVHLHAFLLADFAEHLGVVLAFGIGDWVDDGGLVDVLEAPLVGETFDFSLVAEEDKTGNAFLQDDVGSLEGTFFSAFGQNDGLVGGFCFGADLF